MGSNCHFVQRRLKRSHHHHHHRVRPRVSSHGHRDIFIHIASNIMLPRAYHMKCHGRASFQHGARRCAVVARSAVRSTTKQLLDSFWEARGVLDPVLRKRLVDAAEALGPGQAIPREGAKGTGGLLLSRSNPQKFVRGVLGAYQKHAGKA